MLKYRGALGPAAAALVAWLALAPVAVQAAGATWQPWQQIEGVIDIDGPRTDGTFVVAGKGALTLVDVNGNQTPFARGPGGYHEDPGAEAYIAVSRGGAVEAAGCSFTPDEVFVLRLHAPLGINRVSASGDESGSFVNLPGVTSLTGIVFDTTGAFDHQLLVTGAKSGKTTVFRIDCNGLVKVVTNKAPAVEGGLAVAPSTFGSFGGSLIAPDEVSGKVYSITPDGNIALVARPALPAGGDIGVESAGFVPDGFTERGGAAYYADRLVPGNRHPGSDHLLRLSSADLAGNLVQDGDLLVATEGGGAMVAIRCGANCTVLQVVPTATRAHGEGRIAFSVVPVPELPSPAPPATHVSRPLLPQPVLDFIGYWGMPAAVLLLLITFLAVVAVQAIQRRAR
jgi:hypothetical protein